MKYLKTKLKYCATVASKTDIKKMQCSAASYNFEICNK